MVEASILDGCDVRTAWGQRLGLGDDADRGIIFTLCVG